MLSTQTSDEDGAYVLVAAIDNARDLINLLKAVNFSNYATVHAMDSGLKVTVEDSKCIQGNAFIKQDLFQEYNLYSQDTVTFKINLAMWLECLNIFGSSGPEAVPGATALRLCYAGYGSPLILILEEGGVVTDCSIKTIEPEETLDFEFTSVNVMSKVILKSETLRDVFGELDMSSELLEISLAPNSEHIRFSTYGQFGSYHADIPKECDPVISFQCEKPQNNRYKLCLLKHTVKALAISQYTSIRTDDRGFCSLQFQIPTEGHGTCIVEYFCAPEEDVNDD